MKQNNPLKRRTEVRNAAARLAFEILEDKGFKREVTFKAIAEKLNLSINRVKSYIYGDGEALKLAGEVKEPKSQTQNK